VCVSVCVCECLCVLLFYFVGCVCVCECMCECVCVCVDVCVCVCVCVATNQTWNYKKYVIKHSFIYSVRRDSVVSHVHWLLKLKVSLRLISQYSVLKRCTLLCHLHILRRKHINIAIAMLCPKSQCCSGDRTEKSEMGGTCGNYRGEERCVQGFGGET
jgi:hypothetical protein